MDSECRLAMMAPVSEIQSAVPAAERERRSRRWPRAVVALGTTPALVTAFVLTRPRDTELRLHFAGGRTLRYQIDLSVAGTTAVPGGSVSPYQAHAIETIAWTVESVDRAGVATVRLTIQDASLGVNAAPSPSAGRGASTEIRVAPDGRILSAGDPSLLWGGGTGAGVPGLDQIMPPLPRRPVRPGTSWASAFDQAFPLGRGAMRYSATSSFVRFQDVAGVRAAEIRSSMTVPVDVSLDFRAATVPGSSVSIVGNGPTIDYVGQAVVEQMAWLDPGGGTLVRSASTGTLAVTLTASGFPGLFPTFSPVPGSSLGRPFGAGAEEDAGGPPRDTLQLRGGFVLRIHRLP